VLRLRAAVERLAEDVFLALVVPLPSSLSSRFSIAPSRFSSFSSPLTLLCS